MGKGVWEGLDSNSSLILTSSRRVFRIGYNTGLKADINHYNIYPLSESFHTLIIRLGLASGLYLWQASKIVGISHKTNNVLPPCKQSLKPSTPEIEI